MAARVYNDKDRKAIRRERTELFGALKKDVDLTGEVVEQHTGMAKTFTQGRAMTAGPAVLQGPGQRAPAHGRGAAASAAHGILGAALGGEAVGMDFGLQGEPALFEHGRIEFESPRQAEHDQCGNKNAE